MGLFSRVKEAVRKHKPFKKSEEQSMMDTWQAAAFTALNKKRGELSSELQVFDALLMERADALQQMCAQVEKVKDLAFNLPSALAFVEQKAKVRDEHLAALQQLESTRKRVSELDAHIASAYQNSIRPPSSEIRGMTPDQVAMYKQKQQVIAKQLEQTKRELQNQIMDVRRTFTSLQRDIEQIEQGWDDIDKYLAEARSIADADAELLKKSKRISEMAQGIRRLVTNQKKGVNQQLAKMKKMWQKAA